MNVGDLVAYKGHDDPEKRIWYRVRGRKIADKKMSGVEIGDVLLKLVAVYYGRRLILKCSVVHWGQAKYLKPATGQDLERSPDLAFKAFENV